MVRLGDAGVAGTMGLLHPQAAGLLPTKELERGAGSWLDALAAAEAAGAAGERGLLPLCAGAMPCCNESGTSYEGRTDLLSAMVSAHLPNFATPLLWHSLT